MDSATLVVSDCVVRTTVVVGGAPDIPAVADGEGNAADVGVLETRTAVGSDAVESIRVVDSGVPESIKVVVSGAPESIIAVESGVLESIIVVVSGCLLYTSDAADES